MSIPPITSRDTVGTKDNTQSINTPTIDTKLKLKNVHVQDKTPVDYSSIPVSRSATSPDKPFELSDKEIDTIIQQVLSTPSGLQNSAPHNDFQKDIQKKLKSQGYPLPRGLVAP